MGILNNVQEALDRANFVRDEIREVIESLPDNPEITRLSPNCYTLPFSKLGDNWSPHYHDFKKTYQLLLEWLDTKMLDSLIPSLLEAVNKGKFRYKNTLYNIHPDVIDELWQILE